MLCNTKNSTDLDPRLSIGEVFVKVSNLSNKGVRPWKISVAKILSPSPGFWALAKSRSLAITAMAVAQARWSASALVAILDWGCKRGKPQPKLKSPKKMRRIVNFSTNALGERQPLSCKSKLRKEAGSAVNPCNRILLRAVHRILWRSVQDSFLARKG